MMDSQVRAEVLEVALESVSAGVWLFFCYGLRYLGFSFIIKDRREWILFNE